MMEIPEAAVIASQFNDRLAGKTVVSCEAMRSRHKFAFFHGDPADYAPLLEGGILHTATARGGYVEIGIARAPRGKKPLILALGEGAMLRHHADETTVPAKNQLLLGLEDGGRLCVTVGMYGMIWLFEPGAFDNKYWLGACAAPNPLTDAFDRAHFDALAEGAGKLSAKAFLATEQRIPGLGNGCVQDILFAAGLAPRRRMSTVDARGMANLFEAIKTTLKAMRKAGGRDTERDLGGAAGGYRTIMSAVALADPCPRCGGTKKAEAYLGGKVYYCPGCQA